MSVGQTSTATVVVLDAAGNAVQAENVAWSSSNPAVASIRAAQITALSTGSTQIAVSADGVRAAATLTVTAVSVAPVGSGSVALAASALTVGQTSQATATTRDAGGTVLTGRTIAWSSSNAAIATVSASGLVSTASAGQVQINASSEGQSGNAALQVNAAPAGPATRLTLTTAPPSAATSGVALSPQPVVQLRDDANAAVAQAGVVVQVAIASGGGTLSGTASATTNASGVATFAGLTISGTSGVRTLGFTAPAASPAVTGVTSGSITVSAPVPAGPGCTNEPAGFTVINDQPWDTAPPASSLGWLDDAGNAAARFSIVNDPTAPYPGGNRNVISALFPQGSPGGSAPFYIYRGFSASEQFSTLYLCVYLKHDANFDNTNGNAGTKFLWPAGDQQRGTSTYLSHDGADMEFRVIQQGGIDRSMVGYLNRPATILDVKRGQWVKYELVLKANSSGSANGELHVWLDGTKTHQYTDVNWVMGSARKWLSLAWNPTYGGGLNPVPRDQRQYMDHIRISGGP